MHRDRTKSFDLPELMDVHPDLNVQHSEYMRLLGYPPGHELAGRARELAERTRTWYMAHGRPWIYLRTADSFDIMSGHVRIDGTSFSSSRLHTQLRNAEADTAVLAVVSAGRACEEQARRLWNEEKPDEYFFLEVYGSAVVEHLIAQASFRLCEHADQHGLAVLPHYSPGYPGWDIAEQKNLLTIIRRKQTHPFPAELHVLNTGMLQPKKALLAVFGIAPRTAESRHLERLIPCENCSLTSCQYRRVPYRHFLSQGESTRHHQRTPGLDIGEGNRLEPDPDSEYSLPPKVLLKWARERLSLRVIHNRSIEAIFRYEGTTCSNTGRTLEFDYRVTLAPKESRYRILAATCVPAPTDTGHKYMCEYLNNAKTLMNTIENEVPLIGEPLSAVFQWRRSNSPSGCYCDKESRQHKWGLVLQVLHHALARKDVDLQ